MGSVKEPVSYLIDSAQKLHLSPTLKINELVQQRRAKGHRIVHLGFGEATFPIQRDVLQAHKTASEQTSYLPVAGLDKLRKSIAAFQTRRLGCPVDPEQVVVAPGSKPLLFALFDILDGDVLLPRPSWVSYEPQVLHANKSLFWIETSEQDRHGISEQSLHKAYDEARSKGACPRILLINSPSNPSGRVFSEADFAMIEGFCRERDIALISDEIYSDIVYDGTTTSACASERLNRGNIIMTGGSAGGWRVGYAIFPKNDFGSTVQRAILAYASECWSSASAPAEEAAAVAFAPSPGMDIYREAVTKMHAQCTLRLYQALLDCGLAVAEPKGGFYVYPSFYPYEESLQKLGIHTSLQLSEWLITDCGLAALPGSAFGEDDCGPQSGRYRLRMATSYLYFQDEEDKYLRGYDMLVRAGEGQSQVDLPLLDAAIEAIRRAVRILKST